MRYSAPMCLKCKNFKGAPKVSGSRAQCIKKTKGIPEKIYWEGAKCSLFTPKKKAK